MTPINFITHLGKEHNIKFCPGRVVTNSAAYKHCLAREMSFASACAWHKCLWAYSYQINISTYSPYAKFFCNVQYRDVKQTKRTAGQTNDIIFHHVASRIF